MNSMWLCSADFRFDLAKGLLTCRAWPQASAMATIEESKSGAVDPVIIFMSRYSDYHWQEYANIRRG